MNNGLSTQIRGTFEALDDAQVPLTVEDIMHRAGPVRPLPSDAPRVVSHKWRIPLVIAAAAAVVLIALVPLVFLNTQQDQTPATTPSTVTSTTLESAPTTTVANATRTFVGQAASTIAVGTDAVWVAHGRTVSRIDPETLEVLGTTNLGVVVSHLMATPSEIWAGSPEAGLVRIDPLTGRRKPQEPATETNIAVWRSFTSARAHTEDALWVTQPFDGVVERYGMDDGRLGSYEATIKIGGASFDRAGPTDIAFGHDSLWVTYPGGGGSESFASANTLFRIDPTTNTITASIAIDSGASGVYVDETSVWVANFSEWTIADPNTAKSIIRIDPRTNTIIASIEAPHTALASDAGLGYLWVLDTETNSLVRINIP
jgi:hypothetical protein